MVLAKSTLDVKDLNGKKVAITSAGSGSDLLALWTIQEKKINFTRVPVGGGGLVPNLLAGNVDAAVVYSPLSFQISRSGEARTILDYAKDAPPNLTAGWITPDKYAKDKPQMVQKTLNALYGALAFMRGNKDTTVKLIADLYEIPAEIAALEYDNTIMKLETDGSMSAPNTLQQLELALPCGALIGFAIAENRYFAEVAKPLLFFAFSIPKSIFLPMFILVFGVGFAQKVGFGFFSTIFIVIMSTTTAVESVKMEHLTVARSYGATPMQTAFRVYLPSMLPVLLEALRISMIFNLTGVILAEMYASRDGIGHQIATWGENFQMKQLLAGVVMIAVIAMTFNELVRWVETRCSHWRT